MAAGYIRSDSERTHRLWEQAAELQQPFEQNPVNLKPIPYATLFSKDKLTKPLPSTDSITKGHSPFKDNDLKATSTSSKFPEIFKARVLAQLLEKIPTLN